MYQFLKLCNKQGVLTTKPILLKGTDPEENGKN